MPGIFDRNIFHPAVFDDAYAVIQPVGATSDSGVGTPALVLVLRPVGAPSDAGVGIPSLELIVRPVGAQSDAGVGTPYLQMIIRPVGAVSDEGVGTPFLTLVIRPVGAASDAGVGTPTVINGGAQVVYPPGATSDAGVGTPRVRKIPRVQEMGGGPPYPTPWQRMRRGFVRIGGTGNRDRVAVAEKGWPVPGEPSTIVLRPVGALSGAWAGDPTMSILLTPPGAASDARAGIPTVRLVGSDERDLIELLQLLEAAA